MIKIFITFFLLLLFSGCNSDLFNDKKVSKLQEENQKLKNELLLQQKEQQKSLKLEELKQQSEIKKLELEAQKQKELEQIKTQKELEAIKSYHETMRYAIALTALLLLIGAFFLYLYLKRKREDKLRAYEDNLQKYFLFKEQEMKLKITEKILDTIKESNLSKEDQKKLLTIISQSSSDNTKLIEHKD